MSTQAATDAHVILKPYDLGRSIGHSVTKSIPQILAYAAAGGYVAQRYVERPHALPRRHLPRFFDTASSNGADIVCVAGSLYC